MNSIRAERVLIATITVCAGAVAATSLMRPRVGACGTMHYMLFQMLSGFVVSVMEEFWASRYDRTIMNTLAVILNVAGFGLIVRYWLVKSKERWRTVGVVGLAIVYVASYFYGLPTTACP